MKTFSDLVFKPHGAKAGGVQSSIQFDNGYGASVVSTPFTYGGAASLYELAVLDKDGSLTYSTPITSDVIGWLDETQVSDYFRQIQEL
jgi:hypothetical protein